MRILGIRCSNTDFFYCAITGVKSAPVIEETHRISFPTGYSECELLDWLHKEISDVLGRLRCDAVAIKRAEVNVRRSNSLETRLLAEGVLVQAAAQAGCLNVKRKVAATIAKDLGVKGTASSLKSNVDTSCLQGFDKLADKAREAVLVAWSCM